MKRILLVLLILSVWLPLSAVKAVDVENVHVKDRTRYVSDMAGVLSAEAREQADSLLADIWRQTSAEPVVVIVDNIGGEDINDYATELFTLWGIGKKDKDNGVLMLISIEDRKVVIRTGYGVEGVLPDAICWGIIRNELQPRFREGDYGGGVIAALHTMGEAMTSTEARDELQSRYANDARGDGDDAFEVYLCVCAFIAVIMALLVVVLFVSTRRKPTAQAYGAMQQWKVPMIVASCVTLGMGLPMLLALLLMMRHTRLHKRLCPNCSTRMHRLDEQTDNLYLTPAQDAEERLNSVDYDVWLCSNCNETDIIPYVNPRARFSVCQVCGARTRAMVSNRIIRQATERTEGLGVKTYECFNCHDRHDVSYRIPKIETPPVIIIPGGGGSSGGGFSGGSFGGGATGGGGASGGW